MAKVKRALISVFDKTNLIPFCRFLRDLGIEIVSTGGTARALTEKGIDIIPISDVTGFPEMLDGRVKTLHPKIHGGLLALRENEEHMKTIAEHGIQPIDLVVVNLYPFEKVSTNPESTDEEIIENIDIGGPSMVRSASKNYKSVGIVTNPSQYKKVMKELKSNEGTLSLELKKELAQAAFYLTSHYDNMIASYFQHGKTDKKDFPARLTLDAQKITDLRYGENPHQEAAFYRLNQEILEPSLPDALQVQGKELSFNNILDFDSALNCIKDFSEPACVVVKHTNPCGVAIGHNTLNAFERAWACDSKSAFGSVIAFNHEIDEAAAKALSGLFIEGIIAPDISSEAKQILAAKKNLRLMLLPSIQKWIQHKHKEISYDRFDLKKISGGLLVQSRDLKTEDESSFVVATKKAPSRDEINDLLFAWTVVKHVKSNAIVYVKNRATIGIGAGQMSRVDSVKIGIEKACSDLKGSVLASDAYFPFRDNIDFIAKTGVSAIVQPGGSIRDKEVIDACNEYGISMVFTNTRHFKH